MTIVFSYLLDKFDLPIRGKNRRGETSALIAAKCGNLEVMQRLLSGELRAALAIALETDRCGTSVLMAAVLQNDNDTALWLLRRFGKTLAVSANMHRILPVHMAAAQGCVHKCLFHLSQLFSGNIEFIRIVTKYDGFMVNARDRFGTLFDTVYRYIIFIGSTAVFYAVQGGHLQCVRYLIEKARGDLTVANNRGQSLLHAASLAGHIHIVHWLLTRLERSAIFWQTIDLATPIHCAACKLSPILRSHVSRFSWWSCSSADITDANTR